MENYLKLFEQAIKKQADVIGEETALIQAKKAGLGVSRDGRIVSCAGNPQVVLLRLVRYFTTGGNLLALAECTPLINELLADLPHDIDESELAEEIAPPNVRV